MGGYVVCVCGGGGGWSMLAVCVSGWDIQLVVCYGSLLTCTTMREASYFICIVPGGQVTSRVIVPVYN